MRKFLVLSIVTFICSMIFAATAMAQDDPETLVVTPVNQRGWTGVPPGADTRPGGTVQLILDSSAPAGTGALQLTTDATTAAKAQFMHAADTPIGMVTALGYQTKQNSASFANGAPSYQLVVMLAGTTGFTTFVYEPYNNGFNIVPNTWQAWDVDAGSMWSSRTVNAGGTCSVQSGTGGPPFYTLAWIQSNCPAAKVIGYGVNVGSFNPSYNTEADLFVFNNTTYDFEVYSTPSNMDDCKRGGWSTFNPPPPMGPFKNQGQCIQYVNNGH